MSLLIGIVGTLGISLLCAYRSAAQHETAWTSTVSRGSVDIEAAGEEAAGKTVVRWSVIHRDQPILWSTTLPFYPYAAKVVTRPPHWCGAMDEEKLVRANEGGGQAGVRHDVAVGWPWRAFSCGVVADKSASGGTKMVASGGVMLPRMMVDHGDGFLKMELRAIPLRPIWSGLALNIGVLSLAAFGGLVFLRWWDGRHDRVAAPPRVVRSAEARIGERAEHVERRRRVPMGRVLAALVLGLLTGATTAIVLPLVLRHHVISTGCVSRPGVSRMLDLTWWQCTAHVEDSEIKSINAATAWAYDQGLRGLEFTREPGMEAYYPAGVAPPKSTFISMRTGWPFSSLWGASWREGASTPVRQRTDLLEVRKFKGVGRILNRGVIWLPTRPLWSGWILNTLVFAVAWGGVFTPFERRRRDVRRRRGLCPMCAYDLHATPADERCPECGAPAVP